MLEQLPGMPTESKCYGLRILTSTISNNYEMVLKTGVMENEGNTMLRQIISAFVEQMATSDLCIDLDCPDGVDNLLRRTTEECLDFLAEQAYGDNVWFVIVHELFTDGYLTATLELQVWLWILFRLSAPNHVELLSEGDIIIYRDCLEHAIATPIPNLRYYALVAWGSRVKYGKCELFHGLEVIRGHFARTHRVCPQLCVTACSND